jgi:hypothetical protein
MGLLFIGLFWLGGWCWVPTMSNSPALPPLPSAFSGGKDFYLANEINIFRARQKKTRLGLLIEKVFFSQDPVNRKGTYSSGSLTFDLWKLKDSNYSTWTEIGFQNITNYSKSAFRFIFFRG